MLKHRLKTGALIALLASCKIANKSTSHVTDSWDQKNNPNNFDPRFEYRFAQLPTSGKLAHEPWSDSYWQENLGGIGVRWVSGRPTQDVWSYDPPSPPNLDAVKKMSLTDLMFLSPAEKYDIYMGRFDYPTVDYAKRRNHKVDAQGKPVPDWKGACPAWTVSALYFDEPKEVMPQNEQGVFIPFGSSDIKALLVTARDLTGTKHPRYAGYRCDVIDPKFNNVSSKNPCNGMNAGSFHTLLTNLVRPNKHGFIIDRDPGQEIWNQPVYSYQAQVISENQGASPGAAADTQKEIHIKSDVTYTLELKPSWFSHLVKKNNLTKTETYLYRLELDAQGKILGGMWESPTRPDFAWMQDAPDLSGEVTEMWYDQNTKIDVNHISLDGIQELYLKSIKQ